MIDKLKVADKKYGSISIDVDTLGTGLHIIKNSNQPAIPTDELSEISYAKLLPRFLNTCDNHNIKATFFIIGKHALTRRNKEIIKLIANNGHEIANHTMNHFKHFSHLSRKEIKEEIVVADNILADIIGKPIVGFRAPGYVVNDKIISVLIESSYSYDSSLLPSVIYNAAKLVLKKLLFKNELYIQDMRSCFAPINPFRIVNNNIPDKSISNTVLEIPVNVVPFIRVPFVSTNFSPINYNFVMSCYYFVRKSKQVLNYHFHDCEFGEVSDFNKNNLESLFFIRRIYKQRLDDRLSHFDKMFSSFCADYNLIPLKDMAENINKIKSTFSTSSISG